MTLDRAQVSQNIGRAILIATSWFVLLIAVDYPPEEWIGVVVIGYLMWHVALLLTSKTTTFLLEQVYLYAVSLDMHAEKDTCQHSKVSKRTERLASILVALFYNGRAFTTTGLMVVLAVTTLNVIGFPPFEHRMIELLGVISLIAGLSMLIGVLGVPTLLLVFRKNRSAIGRKASHVRELVWSKMQTRETSFFSSLF